MRAIKWLAIGFAVVLGLVLLGVAWLLWIVDPNDYKADIERIVEQKTARKLVLAGDLELSLWPSIALQMGAAHLSERTGAPSVDERPFVAFESARLSVKLLPLLHKKVEIGDIRVVAPTIHLLTDAQGRHNWDDLAESKSEPAADSSEGGSVDASIASIEIERGSVLMEDLRDQQRLELKEFQLAASGIRAGAPFDLKTSFALERNATDKAEVAIAAVVNADWNSKQYALQKFAADIKWQDAGIAKDGLPIELRADTASVDLAKQILELQGLQCAVGQAQLAGSVKGERIIDAPAFAGELKLAPVALDALMKQFGVSPPTTRDASVLKKLSFETRFALDPRSIRLEDMQFVLDDTTARGKFAVTDLKTLALAFDLNVDRIDFDRYLPPQKKEEAQSGADAAPTPIPMEPLRSLKLQGDLRVGDAKFSGIKLSKLRFSVKANDGDIRIAPIDAALYGGSYAGELGLNVSGKQAKLALVAHANSIDFAPLLHDMVDTKRLSGHGNLNANLTGTGHDTHELLETLSGKLDFNVKEGAYEGMDLWYEIRRARAVLRQQPVPERAGAERTPFQSIQGSGAVANGVMNNQDLVVATQFLKIEGKGAIDLAHSSLDYRLNAKVLRIPSETALQQAEAADAKELVDAEIPIKVTGPMASPKVRPDLEGIAKAKVKEVVEKEKEKLQQKLQDKLKDLLSR